MGALISYINENLDIANEYRLAFGKNMPSGKFFCPFHTNVNTPAAKRYYNGIKCYSCNKFYTVYDLLKTFNPTRLEQISGSAILPYKQNNVTFANKEKIKIVSYNDNSDIQTIINQILTGNDIQI